MNYPNYDQQQPVNNNVTVQGDGERVVVTLKADGGYDAPWVVFHAKDNAEAADLIQAAEVTGLFALIGKAAAALKGHFNAGKGLGAEPVQSPAAAQAQYQQQGQQGGYQNQGYQQQPPPQQNTQQAPPGAPPSCPHGVKKYKTGNSAKGAWKAWMCPSPQGTPDQCPPQWLPKD